MPTILPKRPRYPAQLAKLMVDMARGDVPNDKDRALQALQERDDTDRCKVAATRRVRRS